jgi:hypothetical protein
MDYFVHTRRAFIVHQGLISAKPDSASAALGSNPSDWAAFHDCVASVCDRRVDPCRLQPFNAAIGLSHSLAAIVTNTFPVISVDRRRGYWPERRHPQHQAVRP